ncbi:LuxR C-terminal-related transcriptional regulator [Streptomyces sp. NPDC056347]|uniref:LuxR C-terminal-related transcriptional regulator n=1 Tax=Streptomyces sp. NPDC056347 TaxID=3345790 RepID=UPI0035D7E8B9
MKDDQSGPRVCDCRESSPGGVCDAALAAYRRALSDGSLPAGEVPRCLSALHLLVADRGTPERLVPVPPGTAVADALGPIEAVIAREQRTLRSARAALTLFEDLYADARRLEPSALTRLTGAAVIGKALGAAAAGCRTEVRTAHPGGARPAPVLAESLPRDVGNLRRGIRQRTIYQHTVRSDRATLAYIERVTTEGAEVRTLAEVSDRIMVFDQDLAFVPFSDEPHSALRIEHPALVRFLARHFDEAWARSVPVRPERVPLRTPVVTTDLQRTILRAVVGGETDESIARRLGMSRRSVVEHVRRVSERLGSTSRAQLGYLVATSGLLEA